MRNLQVSILLFVISTVVSCSYHSYNTTEANNKISALPTPSHNRTVNVLFAGELVQDTNYIKTSIIEIVGNSGEEYNSLISKLVAKAKVEGVDAVYIFNNKSQTILKRDGFSEAITYMVSNKYTAKYYSDYHNVMSAVGIKYIRNIDYLDQYIKEIKISIFDSLDQKYKETCRAFLNFDSITDSIIGDSYYYNSLIYPYSKSHLVEEQNESWKYRQEDSATLIRKFYINGFEKKSVTIIFGQENRIQEIIINYSAKFTDRIVYHYYNQRLQKRELLLANGFSLVEEYSYLENKPHSITIYNIYKNSPTPYLLIENIYGTKEDIQLFK